MKGENYLKQDTIVIKLSPGVDPVKRPGLGFYGLTRINSEIHSFFFLLKAVDIT